jgi:hypothetical protein
MPEQVTRKNHPKSPDQINFEQPIACEIDWPGIHLELPDRFPAVMVSCDPRVLLVVIATDTGMIGVSNSTPISSKTEKLASLIFICNSPLNAVRIVLLSSIIVYMRLFVSNSLHEFGTNSHFMHLPYRMLSFFPPAQYRGKPVHRQQNQILISPLM